KARLRDERRDARRHATGAARQLLSAFSVARIGCVRRARDDRRLERRLGLRQTNSQRGKLITSGPLRLVNPILEQSYRPRRGGLLHPPIASSLPRPFLRSEKLVHPSNEASRRCDSGPHILRRAL